MEIGFLDIVESGSGQTTILTCQRGDWPCKLMLEKIKLALPDIPDTFSAFNNSRLTKNRLRPLLRMETIVTLRH